MAAFLSPEWFDEVNAALERAGTAPEGSASGIVVLELAGAPAGGPHALTVTLGPQLRLAPGDHLAAHTLIRLSYADAGALAAGELDVATALREGRLKVSGDLSALVDLVGFLQGAHRPS